MAFYLDKNRVTPNTVISFGYEARYQFGVFAEGYHLAAKSLAEKLLGLSRFADNEAYPIIFLYRHAFELHFKNIIYKSARLCFFKKIYTIDHKLYPTHNLVELIEPVKNFLSILFPSEPEMSSFLENLTLISRDFADIDSSSSSYRYPIDKGGNYSTKPNQVVNLKSIYTNLEPLLDKLNGLDFCLEIESDRSQEVFEYMSQLYNEDNFSDNAESHGIN